MNNYTHLYGLCTPYKENGLEAHVMYPLYIVIFIVNMSITPLTPYSVETRSGHPGNPGQPGHIFSGSSGSDPVYKLSGSDLDWIT